MTIENTNDVRELVDRMRKASRAVYLATEATVADDISDMLRRAADVIEVRPRGTVPAPQISDAAVNAALSAWWRSGPVASSEAMRTALEAAREAR